MHNKRLKSLTSCLLSIAMTLSPLSAVQVGVYADSSSYDESNLDPKRCIYRKEAAAMIARFLQKYE